MNDKSKKQLSLFALWIAVIAGLFCFAVTVILLSDYYRVKKAQPLTSPALFQLREQLKETPDNESLKKQIRELDYIARKAHFTSEAKMKEGLILLAAGIACFLVFIQLYFSLNKSFVKPEKCPGMDNPFSNASKARLFVVGATLWGFAILLIFALFFTEKTPIKPQGDSPVTSIPDVSEFQKNWPGFRGVDGVSKIFDQTPPQKWDAVKGKGVLWKTKIPLHGYSSPIIWGSKIFLTGANKKERKVFCFDTGNGELKWSVDVPFMAPPGSKLPEVTEDTGFAAPTMTTDGTRVFAIFATGDIIGLEMEGKVLWKSNLGIPDNHYAYSSSLLFKDGAVIVQYDDSTRTKIIALNPLNGSVIWENNRKASISWASPAGINNAVITATSSIVSSMDSKTGKTLWSTECMAGEVGPSPVYDDGVIFMANDYAAVVGLDALSGEIIWKNEDYDLPDVASPLASEGRLYLAASFGVLSCINSKTGTLIYKKEFKNGFYSSPILVGDLIYLLDMKGNMFIFKNADKYEEVAKNPLGELTMAVPAFQGKRIYIRGDKHLFCIDGVK